MSKRTVSGVTLTLLFVGMSTLAFNIQLAKASGTIHIRADGSVDPDTATMDFPSDMPLLYVDPENVTGLNPGDSFTVSARIFNLTDTFVSGCKEWHWGCPIEKGGGFTYVLGNLYGLMIDFTWDPNILDYTDHTVTIPVETYLGGVLHGPVFEVEDIVNEATGTYSLSYASVLPAPVFNGDGTVFNMTFSVIEKGTCFLHFVFSKLVQPDTDYKLEIPHYVRDGYLRRDVEAKFTATPATAKPEEPIKFDASASSSGWNGTQEMPITEYRWNFGDGNRTTTSTPTVYHSFTNEGVYYVALTVHAPGATPETDTITCEVAIFSAPIGGYSLPFKGYTAEKPLTLYLATVAILTVSFTMIKRKTRRKTKQS